MKMLKKMTVLFVLMLSISCSSSAEEGSEDKKNDSLNSLPDYSKIEDVPGSILSSQEVDALFKNRSDMIPSSVYNHSEIMQGIIDSFYDLNFDYYSTIVANYQNNSTIQIGDMYQIKYEVSGDYYKYTYLARKDEVSEYKAFLTSLSTKNFRSSYMELDFYTLSNIFNTSTATKDSKYVTNIKIYDDRIETKFANKMANISGGNEVIGQYSYGSSTIKADNSGHIEYYFYNLGLGVKEECKKWTSDGSISDCN